MKQSRQYCVYSLLNTISAFKRLEINTSKKHTLSLNTWQEIFSFIPQKMNPEEKTRTTSGDPVQTRTTNQSPQKS
jgi:hypothetical protein